VDLDLLYQKVEDDFITFSATAKKMYIESELKSRESDRNVIEGAGAEEGGTVGASEGAVVGTGGVGASGGLTVAVGGVGVGVGGVSKISPDKGDRRASEGRQKGGGGAVTRNGGKSPSAGKSPGASVGKAGSGLKGGGGGGLSTVDTNGSKSVSFSPSSSSSSSTSSLLFAPSSSSSSTSFSSQVQDPAFATSLATSLPPSSLPPSSLSSASSSSLSSASISSSLSSASATLSPEDEDLRIDALCRAKAAYIAHTMTEEKKKWDIEMRGPQSFYSHSTALTHSSSPSSSSSSSSSSSFCQPFGNHLIRGQVPRRPKAIVFSQHQELHVRAIFIFALLLFCSSTFRIA
jgi:hypothetical protein